MSSFDNDYRAETYGDRLAEIYDEFYSDLPPVDKTVQVLAELAEDGPALELGIGTGRIALPLVEAGVEVHGIDASERMVEQLKAKPHGDSIPVSVGDFTDVDAPGSEYSLIYVVWNTFYGLLSQQDQIRCLENVFQRLRTGGRLVMSGFVPDLERYNRGQSIGITRLGVDEVRADFATVDPVSQIVRGSHVSIVDGQARTYPFRLRYCWPSELDLMARIAGLELEDRWGGWDKSDLDSKSGLHVNVFRR